MAPAAAVAAGYAGEAGAAEVATRHGRGLPDPTAEVPGYSVLRYRTEISPVEDATLQAALEASSSLLALEDANVAPGAVSDGEPARAENVLSAESALIEQVRAQGYPFAAVPERIVIVDHATREMEVTLMIDPGPRALFGAVTFEGLETMDEGFLHDRLDVGPETPYSPRSVRDMRDGLAQLEVFSRIRIQTADQLDGDGRLPIYGPYRSGLSPCCCSLG